VKSSDSVDFAKLMNGLGEYYGKPMSPTLADIYWNGLQQYDFVEVSSAINAHVRNADTGQFMPKIADVERYLHGNTSTRAMQAWMRVSRAAQMVGTYESVAFDDPLIHACIEDMGGWPAIGMIQDDDLPFKIKEFERRYMAYLQVPPMRQPPQRLIGIFDATNATLGYHGPRDVVMIADVERIEHEARQKALSAPVKTEELLAPDPEKQKALDALIRNHATDLGTQA
jgi:hypothetical protein